VTATETSTATATESATTTSPATETAPAPRPPELVPTMLKWSSGLARQRVTSPSRSRITSAAKYA
jgi:hypothetical protein